MTTQTTAGAPQGSSHHSSGGDASQHTSTLMSLACFATGYDPTIANRCPWSERCKVIGLGTLLVLLGLINLAAAVYALNLVFRPLEQTAGMQTYATWGLCGLIGTAWGLIIFNLYRFIVSSTGYGDGKSSLSRMELLPLLVQAVLAFVIALCVTLPLSILVCREDLSGQWTTLQTEQSAVTKRAIESQAELQLFDLYLDQEQSTRELSRKRERLAAISQLKEALITSKGAADLERLERIDADISQLHTDLGAVQLKIDEQIVRIASLRKQQAEQTKQVDSKIGSIDTLWTQASRAIQYARPLFIGTALFLIILHMSPVLIRVRSAKGVYEHLVEIQNEITYAKYGIARDALVITDPRAGGTAQERERRYDRYLMPEKLAKLNVDWLARMRLDNQKKIAEKVQVAHDRIVAWDPVKARSEQ